MYSKSEGISFSSLIKYIWIEIPESIPREVEDTKEYSEENEMKCVLLDTYIGQIYGILRN
jgi:hypothetical protein